MARQYWNNQGRVNVALKTSLARSTAREKKEKLAWYTAQDTKNYNSDKQGEYKFITALSIEDLLYVKDILKTYTDYDYPVAWDTETTGLNVYTDSIVGVGICWTTKGKPGLEDYNVGCYIPI